MKPHNILTLPGWQGSSPAHWQRRWEHLYGYTRVEEHDWQRPLRGDWMARLEEVLLSCDEPAVLVAHGLGCLQVAAWASHSRSTHRVKAALLLAPPDAEREDMRPLLPSWSPIPLQALPFKTLLLASSDDPFCASKRTRQFASAWGAALIDVGPLGHLNAESSLGDWPEAHEHLQQLMRATPDFSSPGPAGSPL